MLCSVAKKVFASRLEFVKFLIVLVVKNPFFEEFPIALYQVQVRRVRREKDKHDS